MILVAVLLASALQNPTVPPATGTAAPAASKADQAAVACPFQLDERGTAELAGLSKRGFYFPERTWPCAYDRVRYERWFGKHLRAMGEPVFAEHGGTANAEVLKYRLLTLPSFRPATAIRFEVRLQNRRPVEFLKVFVSETGAGGYAPGVRKDFAERRLPPDDATFFMSSIEDVAPEDMPTEAPAADVICMDGVQYVFEVLDEYGDHHLVSRHNCEVDVRFGRLIKLFRHYAEQH